MKLNLTILFCVLIAGCSAPQVNPVASTPPMPQVAVRAAAASPQAMAMQAVVISTTNVTDPQNLSVTTTGNQPVSLFVRSSNEWFQVSPDLVAWQNLSRLKSDITVAWSASTDTNVTGYNVYYGTGSGEYTSEVYAGTNTSLTIPGLFEGTTYYFAATCLAAVEGVESPFSSEVAYAPPIVAPRFIIP
jgi:hypothetical protein